MKLESVQTKNRKRIGRGISAGGGKTAGRGTKGQKSRSGYNLPNRFEGGQTPLSMRLPKLPGFKSHKAKNEVVSLDQISQAFKDGDTVSKTTLVEKGLVTRRQTPKILSNGTLTVKVELGVGVRVSGPVRALFTEVKSEKPKAENKPAEVKTEEAVVAEKLVEKKTVAKKSAPKKKAE
ncbi:MAG: 50S ribosomal protein L15 [Patescibacteria group bacterium]